MTQRIQHHPRTKQNIKDLLHSHLYAPVNRKFHKQLSAIIMKNSNTLGSSFSSFMYRNEVYQVDEKERVPRKMNRLVPELRPDMDEYLRDFNHLNVVEIPYVMGFVNQVLNASDNPQDYIKVLPETMHRPLQEAIDVASYPEGNLSNEAVEDLIHRNQKSIELMKTRLVRNLILN